jgi:hypothetical protein
MNKPEVLIIHHTASGGNNSQYFAVNDYHKSQDFPQSSLGMYVGYHFFIEKNGRTFQARRKEDVGAHTIGWNDRSIGICLAGNFNYENPTAEQIKSLRKLIEKLDLPVDLHKNRQSERTCPGTNLTLDMINGTDLVDMEKEEMIEHFINKYPKWAQFIRYILSL